MYRSLNIIAVCVLMVALQNGFAQVKNQNLTGQSFSGEITVNASPAQVWSVLTDAGQLTKIMGYDYTGGAKKLNTVGKSTQVKVWGDAGNFGVIRAVPQKEIRFSLDPANSSYICSCRWRLTKTATGTKVAFHERYTESSPQSKADIAAQVEENNKLLQRLKNAAESKFSSAK